MVVGVPGQAGQYAPNPVKVGSEQGPGYATSQGHILKDFHALEMPLMKSHVTLIFAMQQVCFSSNFL